MLRPSKSILLLQRIAGRHYFQTNINRLLPIYRCSQRNELLNGKNATWCLYSPRFCSNKDNKKITAASTPKAAAAAAAGSTTNVTKTTQNTATEPKVLSDKQTKTGESSDDHNVTTNTEKPRKIKKLQIGTSKGLLTVTTTIEDSKIDDIIFEKAQSAPKQKKSDAILKIIDSDDTKDSGDKIGGSKSEESILQKAEAASKSVVESVAEKSTAASDVEDLETERVRNTVQQSDENEAGESKKPVVKAGAKTTVATAAAAVKELISSATAAVVSPKKEEPPTPVPTEIKPRPMRQRLDHNRSSLERNFITPSRAMSDFLLKPADLENLSRIKRRSPYEQEPPMTVFWRKDVEAKAIEVWGSRENLLKEILRREIEQKKHQQNLFTVKRRLRDYRREIGYRTTVYADEKGLKGKSGKVVLIAVGINSVNFLFKSMAWLYTGSHSMFAEAIHSLADTINQLILAYGIHKSTQLADSAHPYGYTNMQYVSSLISGVGIFCVGTGLSFYHGITGLMNPEPMEDFFWAFFILGGSLVSEGATLTVAVNEIRRSAKLRGVSFKEYVISGKDPCVNVVLTEDAAAVTSVAVAAGCMGLSSVTGSPVFDAVGSLLIGGILGGVASFIIYTNVAALVGKSINEELLNKINSELESDVMIRAIHDVKGIDMGNSLVRYKAEMDFDGRELTRSYLDKQDLNELLQVVKSFQSIEELEQFLLTHGENIVDLMGGEIDRIEMKLRNKFPEIRHCDLEIL